MSPARGSGPDRPERPLGDDEIDDLMRRLDSRPARGGEDDDLRALRVVADLLRGPGPVPEPGQRLGPFELIRLLGEGAMARVFEARNLERGRRVALKVLKWGWRPRLDVRERFHREARSLARMRHPNLVTVYSTGEVDGHAYHELELLHGPSVRRLDEVAPLPAPEAARLVALVAHACHAAHEAGVLHRDLKPSNVILVGEPPQPRLLDFGFAKVFDETTLTGTRASIGTPEYMAPEIARGDARGATVATDVFGLGALLWAVLAGRPPYDEGPLLRVAERAAEGRRPPLPEVAPEVEAALVRIVDRAMALEPGDRHRTARDLARDLEAFAAKR